MKLSEIINRVAVITALVGFVFLILSTVPGFSYAAPSTTLGVGGSAGVGSSTGSSANGGFKDYFFGCSGGENALDCVVDNAYEYSLGAIAVLGAFMLIVAGIMYMTSGGNPERIGKAKKFIYGTLAGVGLLVLARTIISILNEFLNV